MKRFAGAFSPPPPPYSTPALSTPSQGHCQLTIYPSFIMSLGHDTITAAFLSQWLVGAKTHCT